MRVNGELFTKEFTLIMMSTPNSKLNRSMSYSVRNDNLNRIRKSLQTNPVFSTNHIKINEKLESTYPTTKNPDRHGSITSLEEEIPEHPINSCPDLFEEKFELKEKIGEGSNGFLYRCVKRNNRQEYAVKFFMVEEEQIPQVEHNFRQIKALNHPSLIKYEALYIDVRKHAGWLVMELVKAQPLGRVKLESEDDIRTVARQIGKCLCYLHRKGLAHRDMKVDNILCDPTTKRIKVIDYELFKRFRKQGNHTDMLTITGTPNYRAPEIISGGGYNQKVDVWAFGVTLYALVAGTTPFESEYRKGTIKNILEATVQFGSDFDSFSSDFKSLIKKFLTKQSQKRPSMKEAMNNCWFSHLQTSTTFQVEPCIFEEEDLVSPSTPHHHHIKVRVQNIDTHEFRLIDSEQGSPLIPSPATTSLHKKRAASMLHL